MNEKILQKLLENKYLKKYSITELKENDIQYFQDLLDKGLNEDNGKDREKELDKIIEVKKVIKKVDSVNAHKKQKLKKAKELKEELLDSLKNSIEYNKNNPKNKYIRELNKNALISKNVISVFESSLTRTFELEIDELTTDMIIVKVYYFDIIKDLILNGFMYNGEKYRFFTASAGQIRTKKTVFIKESLWEKHLKTLMCGLDIDIINEYGGINVNKYLAYLALSNSATDEWKDFDIDRCIVVDDFDSDVNGVVDFIDSDTYDITRKIMDINIEHTDGCGMVLPSVSDKNFMIRLPWIKGLMGVFDFKMFINEHGCSPVVKDIYGVEHDIIKEDVQLIFTKSQFKMWGYYKTFSDYKNAFKRYHCQAGVCNKEEEYIPNANINYQMIQTLNDISDEELLSIADASIIKLNNLTTSVNSMLNAFNVTKFNTNKTPLQQALELYPEMLTDIYCKDVLRDIKNSMIKKYKSAKLDVKGKYLFLIPDLYAFCERLFLKKEDPQGLLQNGEVFCKTYHGFDRLDCLRSPHLYKEHAIRKNIAGLKGEACRWFNTDGIYTSCHDLISKMLQFDNDGDKSLVISDQNFIKIAERNMVDIVPLYYEMKKAESVILSDNEIYNGLHAAYTGGNIGSISNDITKIWNLNNIGKDELKAVKLLCLQTNFVIDYAKTLFKPTIPENVKKLFKRYSVRKTPHFFMYAKDKEKEQVEPINNSAVNRLDHYVKGKNLIYKIDRLDKFDYKMLMHNPDIIINKHLIHEYVRLNKIYHFKVNMKTSSTSNSNISYIAKEIKENLSEYCDDEKVIVDMLIKYLYGVKNSKSKESLWFCYGDVIVNNLKSNLADNKLQYCYDCGQRFRPNSPAHKYCNVCHEKYKKKNALQDQVCINCGVVFKVKSKRTKRCESCKIEHRKNYKKEKEKERRLKNKL